MRLKNRLLLSAVLLVLAMPFMFAGSVGAVYNNDAAVHNATTGGFDAPVSYCVSSGAWDGTGAIPNASKQAGLTVAQCKTAYTAAAAAAIKAGLTTQAACVNAGYAWVSYMIPNYCKPYNWTADDPSNTLGFSLGYSGCLKCHNSRDGYIHVATDAKEPYLLGGHKNMSRPIDGKKWGMPGVTNSSAFTGDAAHAKLNADGSFSALWIQEDYPTQAINWATGQVSLGYCAKDTTGAVGTGDVPDLAACPTCVSPVMGNGAAGYPLNYPDAATCAAAASHTGKPYTWTTNPSFQLFWIYGGAGLEGGPAMMEPGSQQYKCGRCHTTGWTADGNTAGNSAKHPWSDGLPTGTTVIGGTTKVTKTSTSTSSDYSSWDQWGIECSRCHIATDGGHATFPSAGVTQGGDVIALCMNCHRQESDTAPRVGLATNAATPYTNKQQQPDGFAHHPDGNEFLNSPHARFTGTWGQMGCPPYAINGYVNYTAGNEAANLTTPGAPTDCTVGTMNANGSTSSLYASKFAQSVVSDLGRNTSTAGGCTSCHDVHKPVNENIVGMSAGSTVACTACHWKTGGSTITPQVDIAAIRHSGGVGTPLADANPCSVCHQPPGIKHLWRISTNTNYTMYGDYTHANPPSGSVNPSNMAPDSTGYSAMWVDLDNACGQCHGGGVSNTDITTGGTIDTTTAAGAMTLTVTNATGFASGKGVKITGAGVAGADFKTIIASVSGNTVYLTYPAVTSNASAVVTISGYKTQNGAFYMTRAQLGQAAKGIHAATNGSPVLPAGAGVAVCNAVSVSKTIGGTMDSFTVGDNPPSTINGGLAGKVFIDWGDGSAMTMMAIGATTPGHTYSNNGTYKIRKTVQDGDPAVKGSSFGISCFTEKEVTVNSLAPSGFGTFTVTANACVGGAAIANVNVYLTNNGHLSFHGVTNAAGTAAMPTIAGTMPNGSYNMTAVGPAGLVCYTDSGCTTLVNNSSTAETVTGTATVYCK